MEHFSKYKHSMSKDDLRFSSSLLIIHKLRPRLHETGANADCYESEDFLKCLHEIGMKLENVLVVLHSSVHIRYRLFAANNRLISINRIA